MKKHLLLLSSFLANFWFNITLITLGFLGVIFFSPLINTINYFQKETFDGLNNLLNYLFIYFILPLSLSSIVISLIVKFQEKEDHYKWLELFILSLLGTFIIFILIAQLSIIDFEIIANYLLS